MAVNKRKLLASAQKNLQKGALDKALRDYLTIVEADPRDANVRLKVGDVQLRRGDREEAIAAYRKVADQFMRDGFDAKAVALYKQITKIDPKRYDAYVPLADLYHRLGLVSEAMTALQTAADALHREGRKREALEVLRRMASLDPTNTTSRLKIAELLRQAGLEAEAVAEYDEAANELERQGDWESRLAVLERILEVRPAHPRALEGLARTLLQRGRADRAETFGRRLVDADPERPESYEVLAAVYVGLDREDAVANVYRQLAEIYRARGDEEKARDIQQRFAPPDPLQLEDSQSGAEVIPGSAEAGEAGGQAEIFEPLEPLAAPETAAPSARPSASPESTQALIADSLEGELTPGEVDQIVAEAGVYLRYGKHERAVSSLEAVLARNPTHSAALEKLGEVHATLGDTTRAVEAYVRAADQASMAGDAARFEVLRTRLAGLDPEAAAEIATLAPDGPGAGIPESEASDSEVDLELGAAEGEPEPSELADPEPDAELDEIDIEIDETEFAPPDLEEPEPEQEESIQLEPAPGRAEVDYDVEAEASDAFGAAPGIELEAGAEALAEPSLVEAEGVSADELELHAEPPSPASGETGADERSAVQRIGEELEEANFYFAQGLLDEAEATYRRILRLAPNHPQALLRLGEIGAARGQGSPAPEGAFAEQEAEAARYGAVSDDDSDPFATDTLAETGELDSALADATRADLGVSEEPFETDAVLADEEVEPEEPTFDSLETPDVSVASESEDEWAAEATVAEVPLEPEATVAEAASEPGDPGDSFDLREALEGVFDPEATPVDAAAPATNEDAAFESIFDEFKRGVSQTLGEGDVETRYDLGIAYREMGLFDDAIGEFRVVLGSPARRLDALHMLALCALDLERNSDAVAHLEQALATPEMPPAREVPLRFNLGRAYEALGAPDRALEAFRRVAAVDPDFQDVAARLGVLERARVADEAEASGARVEGETYESFDDLIGVEGVGEDEDQDEEDAAAVDAAEGETEAAEAAGDEAAIGEAASAEIEAAEPELPLEEMELDAIVSDDDFLEPIALPPLAPGSSAAKPSASSEPPASEPVPTAPAAPEPPQEETQPPPARRRRKVSFV